MQTVLDLSYEEARQYFLESHNYCNMQFPVYIDFKPIIEYVKKVVKDKGLNEILKKHDNKPSTYENVNHKILVKKDAQYSYRPIQLINPYLYYLLVKEMTSKDNWEEIRKRFDALRVHNIEVASIPKVKRKIDKSHSSASVSSWWENVEQRSLELSLSYRYMFVTDITNCYSSLYTHTIAWALMEKDVAKKDRNKKNLLGNKIDNYIQGMQYGQTNGIPQGSVLSDFIAELVLAYADKILSDKLNTEKISEDYRIVRYRDDYRVFCNSKEKIERIAFYLQEVLTDLNFQLNGKKTLLTEEVINESIKPDKKAYIFEGPIYKIGQKRIYSRMSNLQQEALFIHQFSRKYSNSGTLIKLLTIYAQRLKGKVISNDAIVLISIFTDIALSSPKAYRIILAIISQLISEIPTTKEREQIVNNIYTKFQRFPNIGEIQIWMQRITYKLPHPIAYTEDICKIVSNESGIELWNNEWVADEFKKDFPQYSICTNWIRDCYTPIINIDEVSLFNVY